MKKKCALYPFLSLLVLLNVTTFAAESQPLSGDDTSPRWSVLKEDSLLIKNAWFQDSDGEWAYLDAEGYALQSIWFQDIDGRWYYFDEECYMLTDAATPDGYYVGSDGVWSETATVQ